MATDFTSGSGFEAQDKNDGSVRLGETGGGTSLAERRCHGTHRFEENRGDHS